LRKKIQIDPMIARITPLAEINRAFDLMHEGNSIRSVSCTRGGTLIRAAASPRSSRNFVLGIA
jgi:hypothetical protein